MVRIAIISARPLLCLHRITSPGTCTFFGRFYAKRCFLALIENLAKHMIVLKDSSFTEIQACARIGRPAWVVLQQP